MVVPATVAVNVCVLEAVRLAVGGDILTEMVDTTAVVVRLTALDATLAGAAALVAVTVTV